MSDGSLRFPTALPDVPGARIARICMLPGARIVRICILHNFATETSEQITLINALGDQKLATLSKLQKQQSSHRT